MEDDVSVPKYITKKLTFSCPVSPYILWHHGLRFSECPLVSSERDMPECMGCIKNKENTKLKSNKRPRKSSSKSSKKSEEKTPKIGKTYVSE